MSKDENIKTASPKWSPSTKTIVTLLILAAVVALMIRFSSMLNTLVTAVVIGVIFYPLAELISKKTKISWSWSVTIVYIVAVVITFTLLALGGIAIFEQVQNFINFLQDSLVEITNFFNNIPSTIVSVGPFVLDFSYINWDEVSNQLLATIEPALSNLGNVIGGVATGAAGFIGSLFLSMVVSFLILNESGGNRRKIFSINIPGYERDFSILSEKINTIWSTFLRGQGIVYLLRFAMYLIILSVFQVRFLVGMAIVATIGNFIPYIGVAISWITIFLVALLQGSTAFGLDPLTYALIVMGIGWIMDNIYDTFFSPRFMANMLEVHPAAILVGVFVGLSLFGFWGMVLAAPILATLKLLLTYIGRKLLDQDPWEIPSEKEEEDVNLPPLGKALKSISGWTKETYEKIKTKDEE
ncbi:AI-2E family transporter [Pelolinea submarina]|uniref:Putative PurR-regulated permease PerM n=1 Tax=Pelolinea submarina TaxID=913107 RepID=A0A3E0AET2_9CHLR|nr:AI-2E family transporter [Pelolinea submarina]REG10208.1 putative PurR-regulated permease PerM [Pelolinea submarina]